MSQLNYEQIYIYSIVKSSKNFIKFSSNPEELPGLNPRLGS